MVNGLPVVRFNAGTLNTGDYLKFNRLSTIRNADRIYVLSHGEIQQAGTYDELIDQEGLFLQLVSRQIL